MRINKKLQDKLETIALTITLLVLMSAYVWNILINIV
jgi:hypothetical protein